MNNFYKVASLLCLLTNNYLISMENMFNKEAQRVIESFDQKTKQKKLLMDDTQRIRGIKRKRIVREYEEKLKKEFDIAIKAHNLKEIKNLLNRPMEGFKIDINEPIDFLLNEEIVYSSPLVYVATIMPNFEIVKLLLKHGAKPKFNNYSLIFLMLNDFNEDDFFWRFSFESADESKGYIEFCNEYLSILEHLIRFCNFKKANDKEGVCALWSQILEKVKENKICFDKQSLSIISRISLNFI